MEYNISRVYYKTILTELKKANNAAGIRDVIAYLNSSAGLLRKIKTLKFS